MSLLHKALSVSFMLALACLVACGGDDTSDGASGSGGSGSNGGSGGQGGGSAAGQGGSGSGTAGNNAGEGGHGTAGSGGSGGDAGSMSEVPKGVSINALTSCKAQCDAQETVDGCDPALSLEECKALCESLSADTPTECSPKFQAYYECSAGDGFHCVVGVIAQKTTACDDAKDALDKCHNGGEATKCKGANDRGVCPSVDCPCPEGTKPVSGTESTAEGCACLDETTCMDLFCD